MSKICTDLYQSKILSDILPIESADMYYHPYPNDEDWYDIPNFGEADFKFNQLPCWSLAALLDYLKRHNVALEYDGRTWNIFCKVCSLYAFDDPIDACWGMILRLNKEGLL